MNPTAQRIAIAEACGFKPEERGYETFTRIEYGKQWMYEVHELPHYLTDLNAMHEAEKVLTNIQRERYRTELVYQYAGGDIFATAAQRAEALLRTLNLWKNQD